MVCPDGDGVPCMEVAAFGAVHCVSHPGCLARHWILVNSLENATWASTECPRQMYLAVDWPDSRKAVSSLLPTGLNSSRGGGWDTVAWPQQQGLFLAGNPEAKTESRLNKGDKGTGCWWRGRLFLTATCHSAFPFLTVHHPFTAALCLLAAVSHLFVESFLQARCSSH